MSMPGGAGDAAEIYRLATMIGSSISRFFTPKAIDLNYQSQPGVISNLQQ